jgi:antitoxin HicB
MATIARTKVATKKMNPKPKIQNVRNPRIRHISLALTADDFAGTVFATWDVSEKMRTSKPAKTKNKHRGSSFREFLRDDGMLEEVQALALKRAVALKVYDLMKKKNLSKSALPTEMRTSRAAIHRLLDPQNTSVTLATLNRAARSLGQKVKIELVAA